MKCLLIETKDKRKFFTHEKNFVQLIEFSKTFNAELSLVKMEKTPLLNLEELAPAICDARYKKPKVEYEVIETKLGGNRRARIDILRAATLIKKYIFDKLKNNAPVSLKELKIRFKRFNLSDAALSNHLRRAKVQLESQGLKLSKIDVGTYKVV